MGWNKEYAQSIPKEQWVAEHAHHKDEFDLEAEHDKLTGHKAKVEAKTPSKPKADKKSNK